MTKLTPKERALETGLAMVREDAAFRNLGATLETIDCGSARVHLKINQSHTNGHGYCHGGVIFTLADATFGFGFAINSRMVSLWMINYLSSRS